MAAVREQALLLGAWRSLVGVLSTTASGLEATDRPAVVILNSGIIHRVGANRMHVLLARTLAEKWHTVLRFDSSWNRGQRTAPRRTRALATPRWRISKKCSTIC